MKSLIIRKKKVKLNRLLVLLQSQILEPPFKGCAQHVRPEIAEQIELVAFLFKFIWYTKVWIESN